MQEVGKSVALMSVGVAVGFMPPSPLYSRRGASNIHTVSADYSHVSA